MKEMSFRYKFENYKLTGSKQQLRKGSLKYKVYSCILKNTTFVTQGQHETHRYEPF